MPTRLGTFSRKSASLFRRLSSLTPRLIQLRRRRRNVSRIARVRHNQILSGRLQLQSNSRQTSLKKRRLLPLSLCCGLKLSLRKKQKEICRTEVRYQVIKAWSQVLIHPRGITLTSAVLRLDPL